jgi:hypothetical protein
VKAYLKTPFDDRRAELAAAVEGARRRTGCPHVFATTDHRGHYLVEVAVPIPGRAPASYQLVAPAPFAVVVQFLDEVSAATVVRALKFAARAAQEEARQFAVAGRSDDASRRAREAGALAEQARILEQPEDR